MELRLLKPEYLEIPLNDAGSMGPHVTQYGYEYYAYKKII